MNNDHHYTVMNHHRLYRLCWYILCIGCIYAFEADFAHAQPSEAVGIPLDKPEIVNSKITLWRGAQYRWTISGRANIGSLQGPQVSQSQVEIDPRFVITNLGISNLNFPAILPLSSGNQSSVAYCNAGGASLCNIYLATNARGSTKTLSSLFQVVADPPEFMKSFAFVPDSLQYSPVNAYTSTVFGNNLPARFVFVERYGEQNNTYYGDNTIPGTGIGSSFTALIERLSPEIILIERKPNSLIGAPPLETILNDKDATAVYQVDTVNFGNYAPVIGSAPSITRTIKNRGQQPLTLEITRDQFPKSGRFSMSLGDGTSAKYVLNQNDSVDITFRFTPQLQGNFTDQASLIINDPTQIDIGGGKYQINFVLKGVGAPTAFRDQPVAFGEVRVGQPISPAVTITNISGIGAKITEILNPSGSSPFRAELFSGNPPADVAPGQDITLRFYFDPKTLGDYEDVITLRGTNMADVKLVVSGTAILAKQNIITPSGTDTLDFGIVTPDAGGTALPLSLRNEGNVNIVFTFDIQASPNGIEADRFEFKVEPNGRETTVNGQQRTEASAIFTPSKLGEPRLGRREAFLVIKAVEASDRATLVGRERRFVLTARVGPVFSAIDRTTQKNTDFIRFDSVYIRQSRQLTVDMRNISSQSIELDNGVQPAITGISPAQNTDFTSETLQRRVFASQSQEPLTITYKPQNRGFDSSIAEIRYRAGTRSEISTLRLSGYGVEESLVVVSAVPDASVPFVRRDSTVVMLGDVLVRNSKDVSIRFRNTGNIPFAALRQPFTSSKTARVWEDKVFEVVSHFAPTEQTAFLQPNAEDISLRVRFSPKTVGLYEGTYTIESTVKKRIPTAPDTVLQTIIYLQGNGVEPRIDVSPRTLTFDSILVTPSCGNSAQANVRMTNSGTANLTVSGIILPPVSAGTTFQLVPGTPVSYLLRPGNTVTLPLRFSPPSTGIFRDSLRIISNAIPPNDTITIQLTGIAIPRQTADVFMQEHRAKPGNPVTVPLYLTAPDKAIIQAKTASFRLTFDESLLQYSTFSKDGSAATAGVVTVNQVSPGVIDVAITNMQPQGTEKSLLSLVFGTFLGKKASTDLALSSVKIGNQDCPEVLNVQSVKNGTFILDSLCGLDVKTLSGTGNVFALREIFPNPMTDNGVIEYEVAVPGFVSLILYNTQGERVATLAEGFHPEGMFQTRLLMHNLGTGLYFCEMRAGIYRKTIKLFILK